jgi:hypothetical protein
MYTYSFSLKSKQNENAFNHIQTIAAEKKNKARRKERQRSFGNYNHWFTVLNNEINPCSKLKF